MTRQLTNSRDIRQYYLCDSHLWSFVDNACMAVYMEWPGKVHAIVSVFEEENGEDRMVKDVCEDVRRLVYIADQRESKMSIRYVVFVLPIPRGAWFMWTWSHYCTVV